MKKLEGVSTLIVDDEPFLREVLRECLEDEGAVVCEADTVASALKILSKSNVQVVVTDLRMPGETGLSILNATQVGVGKKKPLYFLCTGMTRMTRNEALELGAADLFLKPFDYETVVASIRTELDRKQAARI